MDKSSIIQHNHNLNHVIALHASAGSGKTYALSIQFIKTILSNISPHTKSLIPLNRLLAITFTNKAANEMKERILKQLKLIALSSHVDSYKSEEKTQIPKELTKLNIDTDNIGKLADELISQILKDYSNFQVRTIDSFLRSIIVASIRETGLHPDFQIDMDPSPYIDYAVDKLLSEIKTNNEIKEYFLNFLDIYLHVEGKTSFFPRDWIVETISTLRLHEVKHGTEIKCDNLTSMEVDSKRKALEDKLEHFYQVITNKGIDTNKRAPKIDKLNSDDFSNRAWKEADVTYILTKSNKHYKDILQPLWNDIRKALAELLIISGKTQYSAYCSILAKAEKNIEEITKMKGKILVDDINKYVRKLIKEHTVPELYFNLGERIHHYFIDEFQDTDRAQWNNIKALITDALAYNGSFFYVGDKKQAIYRFKGSDASLFDEVKEDKEIKPFGVGSEYLDYNYRSKPLLVKFYNETFDVERLKCLVDSDKTDELDLEIINQIKTGIENTYQKSRQHHIEHQKETENSNKDDGYIQIEYIKREDTSKDVNETSSQQDDTEQDNENDMLLQRIKSVIDELKNNGIPYSDIAVLVRKNEELKELSVKLKEQGIPVQSVRGFNIKEHPLIIEVMSFLHFLNNPMDNLSFVAFITGEIFSKNCEIEHSEIEKWLLEHGKKEYLYIEFRKWQAQLWDGLIKPLFNAVGYLPAYDIVSDFIERFKINENFPESIGFFVHLLEMLKIKEDNGENNLDSFIEYWDNEKEDDDSFFVPLSSANAVKILTIHKAKGLEFPVVILPFASIKINTKNKTMFVIEDEKSCDGLTLAYINKRQAQLMYSIDKDNPYVKAYIKENVLSFIDELNAFYVAVTRAKKALYIFINDNKDAIYKLFEKEFDSNGRYIKGSLKNENRASKIEDSFPSKPSPSVHWQQHIYIKQPNKDSLEYYKEESRGDIIHKLLSNITIVEENIKDKLLKLVNQISDSRLTNKNELVDSLLYMISLKEVQSWFKPDPDTIIFTEKDVVNKYGETKRIDRLVITRDEAIVIDYKTGGINDIDKHKKQVKEYMDIISELYPEKHVKGFLMYLDHKKVEEVK